MDAFVSMIWATWVAAFAVLVWNCTVVVATSSGKDRESTIKALLNSSVYDNRIPPDFEEDYPTDVTIQIFVLSFDTVTESSMDYSVTIFLRVHWEDKRLKWGDANLPSPDRDDCKTAYSSNANAEASSFPPPRTTPSNDTRDGGNGEDDAVPDDSRCEVLERLEVGTKMMEDIWLPDLYFVNDKEAKIHDVTMANRMLHIYRNGTISTSTRISMTLSCDMYLERYPHDEQTCSMFLGSYSYSKDNVEFQWHDTPIIIREGVTLPRFQVSLGQVGDCNFQFNQGSIIMGNYTCIRADFHLVRQFGYYIAQVYVPSVLIVMLSWVSFWIDLDAIPARVSLGLLTVLTMTTQSTGEKSSLPRVSYLKAIDVWMAGCLVFVFAALLEFAYVNVQSRVEKRRSVSGRFGHAGMALAATVAKTSTTTTPTTTAVATTHSSNGGSTPSDSRFKPFGERETEVTLNRRRGFIRDLSGVQRARMADKMARAVFPCAFIIFNVTYWIVYA